ncbi:hypothetical protein [Bacillus timonensis]|uniref:hypothetical protein n=1 Tax=Bacillus timonensis TaxID=1033734 RepID=UPI0002891FAB|nr:hypothetical protein [Bacillus timonensis]
MVREQKEQKLIENFKMTLLKHDYIDTKFRVNFGRNTKDFADVEFVSKEGEYIVLEAKTHHTRDAHNTYHKLFGELLKETGKNTHIRSKFQGKLSYGILIPDDACDIDYVPKDDGMTFYQKQFNNIPQEIFKKFGNLVNAKYVFVYSENKQKIKIYTWMGFYNNEKPLRILN